MHSGPHSNVTASLSELERKLTDLERELGAAPPEPQPASPPAPAPAEPDRGPEPRGAGVRDEISDLLRIRDQLESATRDLVAEYDRLVGRLREMEAAAGGEQPASPQQDPPEPSH